MGSTASVDGQVAVVRSRRQGSLGQQETDDVCVCVNVIARCVQLNSYSRDL